MQTIEEYKAYTAQLEDEVGKWHEAYDALMIERDELVKQNHSLKENNTRLAIRNKMAEHAIEQCTNNLQELLNQINKETHK